MRLVFEEMEEMGAMEAMGEKKDVETVPNVVLVWKAPRGARGRLYLLL